MAALTMEATDQAMLLLNHAEADIGAKAPVSWKQQARPGTCRIWLRQLQKLSPWIAFMGCFTAVLGGRWLAIGLQGLACHGPSK